MKPNEQKQQQPDNTYCLNNKTREGSPAHIVALLPLRPEQPARLLRRHHGYVYIYIYMYIYIYIYIDFSNVPLV